MQKFTPLASANDVRTKLSNHLEASRPATLTVQPEGSDTQEELTFFVTDVTKNSGRTYFGTTAEDNPGREVRVIFRQQMAVGERPVIEVH